MGALSALTLTWFGSNFTTNRGTFMAIPALEKTDLGKVPVLSQHSRPDEKINVHKFFWKEIMADNFEKVEV